MGATNEINDLEKGKSDCGDHEKILSRYESSSFHLSDIIKPNRTSEANDRQSEKQKPGSYGSVEKPTDGSTIVFCEVSVTINEKTILKRVSGMAKAGEMLCIMGPSGSGKSTLLSVIAGRNPFTSGSVTLNGQPVNKGTRRDMSYVIQNDSFYPILTLREMLTFISMLRLPDSTPFKLKVRRMLEVVDSLELSSCLDTLIGTGSNLLQSDLSGGERKRASIACELITNPKLLLIDEPTSGLDSAIAHDLMSLLAKLSTQQRKTIVTTIHQPSSQIFNMFSKVLLLVAGEVAYFGSRDKITDFFAEIGPSFDPRINRTDSIMEHLKSDQNKLKKMINLSYAMRFQEDWPEELRESTAYLQSSTSKKAFQKTKFSSNDVTGDAKWPTGFWTQYKTLTRRSFVLTKNRFLSIVNFSHCLNMIVLAMGWFQLPRTESALNDRLGVLFFIDVVAQTIWIQTSQFLIYDSWGVFENERSAGIYRISAYYLGTLTAEAPSVLVMGFCYGTIGYWSAGLTSSASSFFLFLLLLLLCFFVAQSFGILISVVVHRRDFSVSIASSISTLLILSAGFYNTHINKWFDWIRYLSFLSRIWSSMAVIEWTYGEEFLCNPANSTSFPKYCTNGTTFPGSAFLSTSKVSDIPLYGSVTIVLCNLILLHVASYLFLRFLKPRPRY